MEKYFDINEEGFSIRSKIYAKDLKSVRRAVLYCHGFGGHKDNRAAAHFAEKALAKYKDMAVIVFDWPCHGDDCRNKLHLSECDTYLRLEAKYARTQFHAEKLYCLATSFGGYLVLRYLAESGNPFEKIVLRCPAVRMHRTITGRIVSADDQEKLKKGKDALVGFDRKVKIDQNFLDELAACDVSTYEYLDYADDILIIHGTKDEIIPFDSVAAFADANVIELKAIEQADHRFQDPKKMDLATKYTLEFFNSSAE